jgi:hypothetical protein
MVFMTMYKADSYITDVTWAAPPLLEGYTAFNAPVEIGGCLAITDQLTVDFEEHRQRYISDQRLRSWDPELGRDRTPASDQTQPDPGPPPDPTIVLVDTASVEVWVNAATNATINGYKYPLWVYEQLSGTSRPEIKSALGL